MKKILLQVAIVGLAIAAKVVPVIAWGGGGTYGRYSWNEEKDDRGNALAITAGAIYGCKKTRFNSKDFGVFSVDTACTDLNA